MNTNSLINNLSLDIEASHTLFSPESVVVIGASRRENSVGHGILKNIITAEFKGKIYAVNPHAEILLGIKVHPSIQSINDKIDLAIIVVPQHQVIESLKACGEKGIKSVIVITAGFKETGNEGKNAEAELTRIAKSYKMALVGPNCLGILNSDPDTQLNATFSKRVPKSGSVSFISQSGAMGIVALEFAAANDIGFSKFASIGNKAVLNENHLLSVFANDPSTNVILVYLESLTDPREFIRVAKTITNGEKGIPILVIKTGRGKTGQKAALSHTGALAENDNVLDFIFEQCGVIRVNNMEDLFNFGLCLANQPYPKGERVAIVTNAGGAGIIAADEADRLGIKIPELSKELQQLIAQKLPPNASVGNPIDVVGDASEGRYDVVMETLVDSNEVDAILVICTPQIMTDMTRVAGVITKHSKKARKVGKTIVASFVGFDEAMKDVQAVFDKEDIPNYRFTEDAVGALATSIKYEKYRTLPLPEVVHHKVDKKSADQAFKNAAEAKRNFLTEPESYKILEAYGFSMPKTHFVTNMDEIGKIAPDLKFPVVAKIVSPDIIHKFDVGGVITAIENEKHLEEAYRQIMTKVMAIKPQPQIDGILIQEMIKGGVEIIIGANYNEHYGHLLMFGLGGTFVEVLKDVTFRMAPVSTHDARVMIEEIKSFSMLKGFRGMPPRDLSALVDCITRLSQLITDFPAIREIDLNPVFALEQGAKVADARILL